MSNNHEKNWKSKLTDIQYHVTQECGTEPAFKNEYWNNKKPGIYVDIVSGEPLFSSKSKYDSGTGWPSFSKTLATENIIEKEDLSYGMVRTEVRSKKGNSHLGHVFNDGPAETGLRYCINSASLRFIAAADLEREGYGEYLKLFPDYAPKTEKATFAGGCFWGTEEYFRRVPGVLSTRAGYAGGSTKDPSYKEVTTGTTGHAESIEIIFDPQKVSYDTLLKHFWRIHDPTSLNKQGNDVGTQYRSAIYYHNKEQKKAIERSLKTIKKKYNKSIVTEVAPRGSFYEAEEYHQDYLQKHPNGYCHIDMKLLLQPLD